VVQVCAHGLDDARQDAINRFNAPDSLGSVALIGPKGRGVETNFTAADTLTVYDSHGNRENNPQAAAHCMTVGKAKQTTMYRSITVEGWERAILDCAYGTTTADCWHASRLTTRSRSWRPSIHPKSANSRTRSLTSRP